MIQDQSKEQKPLESGLLEWRQQIFVGQIDQISDKLHEYEDYFKQYQQINWREYIKAVQQQEITINFDTFSPFQIKILGSSLSYQITQAEIKWAYYSIKIVILNSNRISCFHSCRFASGSYGKVYFYDSQQAQSFVVKCTVIDRQTSEDIYESKLSAFKQYFITKLASVFGCGPFMKKYAGFDIIFSQNCIEFAMEQCAKPNKFNQKSVEHLRQHLFNLHQGGIIHFDIKPENIMWSNHFKKQIFIDFGLSQINNCKIGYKQYVYFKGSLEYCSKEMSVLFQSKLSQPIDIHYNDVFALKQSVKQLRINSSDRREKQNILLEDSQDQSPLIHVERVNTDLKNKYSIIILKYYVYKEDHDQILKIYNYSEDKATIFEGQILNFIKQQYSANLLFDFFKKYVSSDINGSVQFGWLEEWSKSIFSQFSTDQQHISGNKTLFESYYERLSRIDKIQPQNLNYLNLSELQWLLFTESITDQQYYFCIFMAYISFTNNVNRIGIQQKIKAAQYFIFKLMNSEQVKNELIENKSQLDSLFFSLHRIFVYILLYYINKTYESHPTSLKILQRLDLCLQIIQQSFLICLMSTEQILNLMSQLYLASLWRQQDRLQIICRISYYILWNKYPLIPAKMYDHMKLLNWLNRMSGILNKQKQEAHVQQLKQLQQQFYESPCWDIDEKSKVYEPFTKTLKLYSWIHQITQNIRGDPYLLFSAFQWMQKIIPSKMKLKIFPFYNELIGFIIKQTRNTQHAWKLCQKIKMNVISKEMIKEYLPILAISSLQSREKIKIAKCLRVLFSILSPVNYFSLSFIIESLISELLRGEDAKETKEYLNTLQIIPQLTQTIKQTLSRFHFQQNQCTNFHGSGYNEYYYFTLRFILKNDFGVPYNKFKEQINELQKNNGSQKCKYCNFRKKFVILLLRQDQIQSSHSNSFTSEYLQNHRQMVKHVNCPSSQDYNRIQLLNFKIVAFSLFIKSMSFKGTVQFPQFDNSVIQLYHLLKRQQKISYYIYMTHANKALILITLNRILAEYGMDQLIGFIIKIVSAQKYLEATQFIFCLSNNFKFFNDYLFLTDVHRVFLILHNLQKFQKKEPYIMLYYFGFVLSSNLFSSMKRYIYKTLKLLEGLPVKICLFMTILLYDLILHQQPKLIPYLFSFNQNCKEEFMRKIERKTHALRYKLTKLTFYFLGGQVVQPKKIRTKCKKRKQLFEKCNSIKNIKIWIPHETILSIKPKARPKRSNPNQ